MLCISGHAGVADILGRVETILSSFSHSFVLIPNATAKDVVGTVHYVVDGDTAYIAAGNRILKIRFASIDAPESKQPFGDVSRVALQKMIGGKRVTLKVYGEDHYGRTIADVYIQGKWINLEMVKGGFAWVYRKYNHSKRMLAAEKRARIMKKGLWKLPLNKRMPPWQWRKQHR